jgi:hypothetical protein
MQKRALPIVRPCDEDWGAMRREGDGRRCDRCATTVVDLSALTEREAKRLIARAGGDLCVRYRADADGEVRFRPAPLRRGVHRLAVGLGLASLVGAATPAFADNSIPPAGDGSGRHPAPAPSQPPAAAPAPRPGDHPRKPPLKRPEEEFMGKLVAPDF